jgi:hypothetical protein
MKRPSPVGIVADAYFDTFSMAALFCRLRIPCAPRQMVDSRPLKHLLQELKFAVRLQPTQRVESSYEIDSESFLVANSR